MGMKITIYTMEGCSHCEGLRSFLKEKKFDFEEINIGSDSSLIDKLIKKSGQMKVPITVVDKDGQQEKTIAGFESNEDFGILLEALMKNNANR